MFNHSVAGEQSWKGTRRRGGEGSAGVYMCVYVGVCTWVCVRRCVYVGVYTWLRLCPNSHPAPPPTQGNSGDNNSGTPYLWASHVCLVLLPKGSSLFRSTMRSDSRDPPPPIRLFYVLFFFFFFLGSFGRTRQHHLPPTALYGGKQISLQVSLPTDEQRTLRVFLSIHTYIHNFSVRISPHLLHSFQRKTHRRSSKNKIK